MRFDGTTHPRKAVELNIGFLSAVDMPAHEGAQVTILKAKMMQPVLKTIFSQALAEKQYEQAAHQMLCQMYEQNLNTALVEAAEDIGKDPALDDAGKQAALRAAVDEYIVRLHSAMVGTPVAKAAQTKTEDGQAYPASDFAYVPDPAKPSEWKLRLTSTPGGEPDPAIVGAAAAALGEGFRGNKVEIPEADRAAVVNRVRAAWHKANPDKSDDQMPQGIAKQEADMADEQTQAELAKFKALSELTDLQKAHYATLGESEQVEFLKGKRDVPADESFTDVDGAVVSKSAVGSAAYTVLKAANTRMAKMQDDMDMQRLTKRAETELKHLPGDVVAKARVLKAVERMPEAERATLDAILKSADAAAAPGFKPAAVAGEESTDPADKLEKMAKQRAADKSISFAQAYNEVLTTDEGKALYKEMQ